MTTITESAVEEAALLSKLVLSELRVDVEAHEQSNG